MKALKTHLFLIKQITFSPQTFYQKLTPSQNYKKPLFFFLVNNLLTILLSFLLSLIFTFNNQTLSFLPTLIISLPLFLIFLLTLFFLVVLILHLLAKILGGKGTFTNSLQVIAYASAVLPLTALPLISLPTLIYQIYLIIIGFAKVHQYSPLKAVLNILLSLLIILTSIFLILTSKGYNPANLLQQLQNANFKNQSTTKDLEPSPKNYPTIFDKNYPTGYQDYQEDSYYSE